MKPHPLLLALLAALVLVGCDVGLATPTPVAETNREKPTATAESILAVASPTLEGTSQPDVAPTGSPSPALSETEEALPTRIVSVSTPSARSGECMESRTFPTTLTTGSLAKMTLHFKQQGCRLHITQADIRTSSRYTRTVTFDPPLSAGALQHFDSLPQSWDSKGSFQGTANLKGDDLALNLRQNGQYIATARIEMVKQLGEEVRQWARSAKASSEYGSDGYSAKQTTGNPDTPTDGDHPSAWAPSSADGTTEWLELTYGRQVIPAAVNVYETYNPGFVTNVEAFDAVKSQWLVLWQGTDTTKQSPGIFSPPLSRADLKTNRIRLTINTSVPGWNEIDAVELVGRTQPEGWVVFTRGQWVEQGTAQVCDADGCEELPWTGQPPHEWYWAFNTLTGKIGLTPDEVD